MHMNLSSGVVTNCVFLLEFIAIQVAFDTVSSWLSRNIPTCTLHLHVFIIITCRKADLSVSESLKRLALSDSKIASLEAGLSFIMVLDFI